VLFLLFACGTRLVLPLRVTSDLPLQQSNEMCPDFQLRQSPLSDFVARLKCLKSRVSRLISALSSLAAAGVRCGGASDGGTVVCASARCCG